MDTESKVILIIGLFIGAFLLFCFVQFGVSASTDALCAQNGWRDSKVTWNFQRYCIREENEYEIIVPLYKIMDD